MVKKEITHSLQECLLASVVQYGGSFYLLDRTVTTKNTCKIMLLSMSMKKEIQMIGGDTMSHWWTDPQPHSPSTRIWYINRTTKP
jgi:hypothetical protein